MGRKRTINYKNMSREARSAYYRVANKKARDKRRAAAFQLDLRMEPTEKFCRHCERMLPNTTEYFTRPVVRADGRGACRECEVKLARAQRIRKQFGLTVEEYNELFVNASCGICGVQERLVLDHCHASGDVRRVLCQACNTGLGSFSDDPSRLRAAAAYVESFWDETGLDAAMGMELE